MFIRVCLIVLLTAPTIWSQVDAGAAPAAEEPMATPSPVNVEGPSLAFVAEQEHTNYLRGGLSLSSAYDDGLLTSTGAASDISYSVQPSVAIEETGARLHWSLFYSPGFTFYQRNTSLNQSDHDLTADLRYRLSPHVTLTFRDGLTKSSAFSSHFNPNPIGAETGILQSPNQSVISPIADTISNNADGQITYQFSANGMIGASGTETEQRYLHLSQVPGLFNLSSRIATAFYTHRLSRKHYIGATYQFQQLLSHSHPSTETQTHGAFLFYTLYATPVLSLTLFGGGQHFELTGLAVPSKLGWSPAGGATLGWQGRHTSVNLSFVHRITDGSGLQSAAFSSNADLSIRHQLSKNLTGVLGGGYAINSLVDPLLPGSGGHSVSGNVSLQRTLGEHFSVDLGYARSHQSYSTIPAISSVPNRNRVWVAFSYKFERPLGR
jgi:hypothetical protein